MFAYCGNNPVNGYDPTGQWDLWGVISGISIILAGAALVSASVTTSPLVAPVGVSAGVALIETGAAITYAAATDSTAVIDVSYTNGYTSEKYGYSIVLDYGDKTTEVYSHYGVTTSSTHSITYGAGVVFNYDGEESYGGTFADFGASTKFNGIDYGIDGCFSPNILVGDEGTAALMGTVGLSFPALRTSTDVDFGFDHYDSIYYTSWR